MAEQQPGSAVSSRPLIYISYSRRDRKLVEQMLEAIRAVVKQADIFYDVQISPGDSFSDTLLERLSQASIVLFCMSPDALKSRYCQREMEIGLSSVGKRLIPIILKPCDWGTSPLARFRALPSDARPVSTWKNREQAISDIARGIEAVVVSPAPQAQPNVALPAGHTARVRRIVVTPDGTRAVSASDDGTAILWDLATLQSTAVARHEGPVTDVVLQHDGQSVLTSSGRNLFQWDFSSGTLPVRTATWAGEIVAFAAVGDGEVLAAGQSVSLRASGAIRVEISQSTLTFGQSFTTIKRGASKDKPIWVAGISDGQCYEFDWDTVRARVSVAKGAIVEIHPLPDGVRYLSCSTDGHLQVMSFSPSEVHDFTISSSPLAGIAPMPDGKRAAVAATEAIKLVDLSTGAILREWPFANDPPTAIAVTPDGARIVWGTASGKVSARSIDLTTQRPLPVGEDRLRLAYLAVLELPELWAVLESLDESALAGVGSQLQLGPDQDVLQALQSRRPGIEPPPLWTAWMTSLYPSKVGKPQGPR